MTHSQIKNASQAIDILFMLMAATLHPSFILLAIFVYGARRWPLAAQGFLSLAGVSEIRWWHLVLLPGAAALIMSSKEGREEMKNNNENSTETPATTTPATSNNALQSGATNSNELLLGQARALAALVKAGKIGETEGIKMVFGVSPSSTNPRYIAARAALKAELEKLNNHYPLMTPEMKRAREELGLSKP